MKNIILLIAILFSAVGCKKEPLTEFEYLESAVEVHYLNKKEVCDKLKFNNPLVYAALPDRTLKVAVLHYRTKDPHGNEIMASGTVTYPSAMPSYDQAGAVLAVHFTLGADRQVPSKLLVTHESLFALFGYVVVAPDYIGYGNTVGLPHPYHHHASTSQASVDLLFAAKEYFASMNRRFPHTLRIVGYSEGGYAALSSLRYIEENHSSWLDVKEVFAGAGAYDLPTTYKTFIETKYSSQAATIPMIMIGLDYGDSLKLDYTKLFKGPLLENYKEWILSKKYTTDEMSKKIGSTNLTDFLAPEVFDPENVNTKKLLASLVKNEMTQWTPKCKVTLVHGNKDSIVPYINSIKARDSFASRGCDVNLVTVEGKDHIEAGSDFYTLCMLKLIMTSPSSDHFDKMEDALEGSNFNFVDGL